MNILNITNLTENPKGMIREKFNSAFEDLESELSITIDEKEKYDLIEGQIDWLEDQADETKGSELLGLIDNYLVNHDYYADVKEWYDNK